MAKPTFLTLDEILHIHRDQSDRYGGQAGVRDLGLLESAVAMSATGFGGEHAHDDLFEMAAAYLFHIVKNHPFIDGNKRSGTVAADVFLEMNDIDTDIDEDELVALVLDVAGGLTDKKQVAAFFRERSQAYLSAG